MKLPRDNLHAFFIQNRLTLSLAESCTGGGIASQIVQMPDCSLYFLGSLVAYSNHAKRKLLKVNKATLAVYGAVSTQTAEEMALGALKQFNSDYALATTGIAGPSGGTKEKPVGTVCFAIVTKQNKILSWSSHFDGERSEVILHAIDDAFMHLWSYLDDSSINF